MSESAKDDSQLVHQILFTLSPNAGAMPVNCQKIMRTVGENRYRLWTLDSAREYLVNDLDSLVVEAFDRLKPFAYKADLFRYWIILKQGGFYLDLSVNDVKLPDVGEWDFIGFRDLNNEFSSWKVANNFFFARAGSAILDDCLRQIVENCDREFYGRDPHFPTGPSVLGRSVAKLAPDLDVLIGQYWWFRRRRNRYVLPGYGLVGRGKVGGHRKGGVSGVIGGNNYNEFWRARDVYQGFS